MEDWKECKKIARNRKWGSYNENRYWNV
jgi:hypothetical protein